ncbi:hypothetical protein [Yinghuangia seranimata]|uniref:hypothetical protein n=1 Tax=Yinghuangia seranimata TaxID=408067 RepID=UPI00248D2F14|nr:hypothetical protein [Yinghuangia seranimata]MDI2130573.1 hypothetical protein [Yinghuangia seranimata]
MPTMSVVAWATWMARQPPNARHHNRARPSVAGEAWQAMASGAHAARSITTATRTMNPSRTAMSTVN